jgi:hypothetical protein
MTRWKDKFERNTRRWAELKWARMDWVISVVAVLLIAAFVFICWSAATYEVGTGKTYRGWRRLLRFLHFGGFFPF